MSCDALSSPSASPAFFTLGIHETKEKKIYYAKTSQVDLIEYIFTVLWNFKVFLGRKRLKKIKRRFSGTGGKTHFAFKEIMKNDIILSLGKFLVWEIEDGTVLLCGWLEVILRHSS